MAFPLRFSTWFNSSKMLGHELATLRSEFRVYASHCGHFPENRKRMRPHSITSPHRRWSNLIKSDPLAFVMDLPEQATRFSSFLISSFPALQHDHQNMTIDWIHRWCLLSQVRPVPKIPFRQLLPLTVPWSLLTRVPRSKEPLALQRTQCWVFWNKRQLSPLLNGEKQFQNGATWFSSNYH
jgi:hypothetical protein